MRERPTMAPRTPADGAAETHRFHTIDGAVIEAEPVGDGRQSLLFRATLHFTSPPLAGLALRGFGVWRTGAGLLVTPPRLNGHHPFLIASHLAASDLVEQAEATLRIAVLDACSGRQLRHERDDRRDPHDAG